GRAGLPQRGRVRIGRDGCRTAVGEYGQPSVDRQTVRRSDRRDRALPQRPVARAGHGAGRRRVAGRRRTAGCRARGRPGPGREGGIGVIEVEVNGETREVAPETTVAALLEELGAARPGVAVAMNGHVVSRSNWADTTLSDGAQVEILSAVQGG